MAKKSRSLITICSFRSVQDNFNPSLLTMACILPFLHIFYDQGALSRGDYTLGIKLDLFVLL